MEEETATTPVFLPGEFHGQRSLVGFSPWGHKESDTTEELTLSLSNVNDYAIVYRIILLLLSYFSRVRLCA